MSSNKTAILSRTCSCAAALIQIPPGSAKASRRAAIFTPSPVVLTLRPRCSGDLRVAQFLPVRSQRGESYLFVLAHQPRIACDIDSKDRRQPTLDPSFAHRGPALNWCIENRTDPAMNARIRARAYGAQSSASDQITGILVSTFPGGPVDPQFLSRDIAVRATLYTMGQAFCHLVEASLIMPSNGRLLARPTPPILLPDASNGQVQAHEHHCTRFTRLPRSASINRNIASRLLEGSQSEFARPLPGSAVLRPIIELCRARALVRSH